MSENENSMNHEEKLKILLALIATRIESNVEESEIINELMEMGLNNDSAELLISLAKKQKNKPNRDKDLKNIIMGAVFCIGGVIMTSISYNSASTSGGTYTLFIGAMIGGAIQFCYGLFNYLKG